MKKIAYTIRLPDGSIATHTSITRTYQYAVVGIHNGVWKILSWAGDTGKALARVREYSRYGVCTQVQMIPCEVGGHGNTD